MYKKLIAISLLATALIASAGMMNPLAAQEQKQQQLPEGSVILPLVTLCSPIKPDLGLYEKYGEEGFIEAEASIYIPGGRTVDGKLKMFMKPGFEKNTFTLMFEVGSMHCMISSGINAVPVTKELGDPM